MTPIKDGKGRGYLAEVNEDQQLEVLSKSRPAIAKVSKDSGGSYVWTAVSADIDTGDTALLVCNDSQTKNLHITKVYCWADVAVQFKMHTPAYPTLAGTAVVGVCLNRALAKTAEATAKVDETGNTFVEANVVKTLRNNELATDEFGVHWDFEGALILGYHNSIAIDIIGESLAFECSVEGYYEK